MNISIPLKTKLRIIKCMPYLVMCAIFMINIFLFTFFLDRFKWPLGLIFGVIVSLIIFLLFVLTYHVFFRRIIPKQDIVLFEILMMLALLTGFLNDLIQIFVDLIGIGFINIYFVMWLFD